MDPTSRTGTAKIFMHGRSQAVRLPKAFRLDGTEVRVRRVGQGLLLEPVAPDLEDWLTRLDAHRAEAGPFMEDGRRQPDLPAPPAAFD